MVLRPRGAERDAAAIRAVYSEPDIRYWMGWDGEDVPGDAEARANIERAANAWREGTWAVFRIVGRVRGRGRRRGQPPVRRLASRAWPDGTRFESILFSLLPDDSAQTGSGGRA